MERNTMARAHYNGIRLKDKLENIEITIYNMVDALVTHIINGLQL